MTTSFEKFNRQLGEFGEKIDSVSLPKLQRLIALTVLRGVVLKTPVASGRAQGNWQLMTGTTVNSEVPGTIRIVGKGKKKRKRWASSVGGGPVGAGMANLKPQPGFQTIYVFNNVPYINRLEQGHSKIQAPLGMVAVTLAEVEYMFND